jgi:hypothetical protein
MGLSMSLVLTNFNLVLGWRQLEASGGHWQLKARAGPFNLKVTPESFQPDFFFNMGLTSAFASKTMHMIFIYFIYSTTINKKLYNYHIK